MERIETNFALRYAASTVDERSWLETLNSVFQSCHTQMEH